MTQRLLRLYALVFAASGAAFVAGAPLVYWSMNLAVGLLPGAKPLTDNGPGVWLALAGSMMAMITYLCLEAARDPGQEAAWNTLLLSKAMSTTLFVVFAAVMRNSTFLIAALVDGAIFVHLRYLKKGVAPAPRAHFTSRLTSGTGDFYEVWFAKLNDPSGNAAWLRYTLSRGARGGEASCWYIVFDKEAGRTVSGKWSRPLDRLRHSEGCPFDLEDSRLEPGRMTGKSESVSWDFAWSHPTAPPFAFVPRVLGLLGLASSDYITPVSLAHFDGTLRVEGRDYVFRKAPGSIGHIWGTSMADNWRWAHAVFKDADGSEAVFEILSAQVRRGSLVLPRLTCAHLWRGGRHYSSVGLWRGFQNESVRHGDDWSFRVVLDGLEVSGECAPSPGMTATLDYESPDGRRLVCRNSKTGSMTLRAGAGAELKCEGAAAVEFVEAAS